MLQDIPQDGQQRALRAAVAVEGEAVSDELAHSAGSETDWPFKQEVNRTHCTDTLTTAAAFG